MGDAEFLLVLPDGDPTEVARRPEGLRLAVRAYPWREVTGHTD